MKYSIESAEILEEIMNRGISNMDEVDSIFNKLLWLKEDSNTGGFLERIDVEGAQKKIQRLRDEQIEGFRNQITKSSEAMEETERNIKRSFRSTMATEVVYNYDIDDVKDVLNELNTASAEVETYINEQQEALEEAQEFEGVFKTELEKTLETNIESGNTLLEFINDLQCALQNYHDTIEEHVEGYTTGQVEIDIVAVEDCVDRITEIIDDQSNFNDIVKEKNSFDVWETTLWVDIINFSKEEKKEKEAFKENRKILDDLNDYLYSNLNLITEAKDVLQTTFHTAFEPLSSNEWIDRLLEDLELNEFDFSEFSDISFVDDMINHYKNNFESVPNYDELDAQRPERVSTEGGEFLFSEESDPEYLEYMYGIKVDEQRPYHVITEDGVEEIWTIGPGITSDTEQGCYDRVNDALGYNDDEKNPPETYTEAELNEAAAVIMSNEYASEINEQIDSHNKENDPNVQELNQYQFDCIAQFYWQCGAGNYEYYYDFYATVANVQISIENGDTNTAYIDMCNIFSYYGVVPEQRCIDAANLFVYGDYGL